MAYVSVDSPVPQNGMMAPPAACVDASNAVIELARRISQNGRELVYSSVPTLESVAALGPGVADSAAIVLPQSDLARGSVLTGAAPAPDASTLTVRPTYRRLTVIPLNWRPSTAGVCAPQISQRAPIQQPVAVPLMPLCLPAASPADIGRVQPVVSGCQFSGFLYRDPATGKNLPAGDWCGVPVPRVTSSGGVAGYAPTWGDALTQPGAAVGGGAVGSWVRSNPWLALGVVGVAVVVAANSGKRKGRG